MYFTQDSSDARIENEFFFPSLTLTNSALVLLLCSVRYAFSAANANYNYIQFASKIGNVQHTNGTNLTANPTNPQMDFIQSSRLIVIQEFCIRFLGRVTLERREGTTHTHIHKKRPHTFERWMRKPVCRHSG